MLDEQVREGIKPWTNRCERVTALTKQVSHGSRPLHSQNLFRILERPGAPRAPLARYLGSLSIARPV